MFDFQENEEEEYAPLSIPKIFRNIDASQERYSVRKLTERFFNNQLILEPDFQREYVWDSIRASRYIESLLLRLPTPPIFISNEKDGTSIVIDGHQRLETLFRFMQPLLGGPAEHSGATKIPWGNLPPLTLKQLSVLSELNGKGVDALEADDREKLWDTFLSVIEIPVTAHPDMKYELFARLNQGSMSLNAQELRNCLYRGPYNNLIASLSENQNFLDLWNLDSPNKRMHCRELVLRFFAFLHRFDKYRSPLRSFLNEEMRDNIEDYNAEQAKRYRNEFENALVWTKRIFAGEAFRQFRIGDENRPNGRWTPRRYDTIYEVEMVGFAIYGSALNDYWKTANSSDRELLCFGIRKKLIDIMTLSLFVASINQGTGHPDAVHNRFVPWQQTLNLIVGNIGATIDEAKKIQSELNEKDICPTCSNPITADDAALGLYRDKMMLMHHYCRKNSE
jgi:hypothetical protein